MSTSSSMVCCCASSSSSCDDLGRPAVFDFFQDRLTFFLRGGLSGLQFLPPALLVEHWGLVVVCQEHEVQDSLSAAAEGREESHGGWVLCWTRNGVDGYQRVSQDTLKGMRASSGCEVLSSRGVFFGTHARRGDQLYGPSC
ncbi:hypothetical protein BDW74DRAFT_150134 [Aspergillus multicolor]|uniref:uncharacterized protein n=1 Tax=Aspergillus multicolor TaxID=41759 RepID=UPI003CCCD755